METAPFSMADVLNTSTRAAYTSLAMREVQNQLAAEEAYRRTAKQATFGAPGQVPQAGQSGATAAAPPTPPPMIAAPGPQNAPTPAGGADLPMSAAAGAAQPPLAAAATPTPGQPPAALSGQPQGSGQISPAAQQVNALFQTETAGHAKGYDPEYHAQLLEAQGFPDKADQVRAMSQNAKGRKMAMNIQVLDYMSKAAPLVQDQASLDALRGSMQAIGLDPNMLPAQFNPQTQHAIMTVGIGAAKMAELQLQGRKVAAEESTAATRAKHASDEAKHWQNMESIARDKAAKEKTTNNIPGQKAASAAVAQLFGGVYNPLTGQITGIDKDKATQALSIMETAERIWTDGGGKVTPAEAAARAARMSGIKFGAPGASTPPPAAAPLPPAATQPGAAPRPALSDIFGAPNT